jgi:transposase
MISVTEWAEIRRLYKVEKLSKRAIARHFGIHRNTVTRALASATPQQYQRQPRLSILAPYQAKIHTLLTENAELSAVRILDLLCEEGYPGQISILRAHVRQIRSQYKPQPVYIRMEYRPGEYGQVDWGEMPEPVHWQDTATR